MVSFVTISLMHFVGDGNCWMPLAQDLLSLYEVECGFADPPHGAALRNGLENLQQRLFDTLMCRPTPNRASLRGLVWKYHGKGYGHGLALEPGLVKPMVLAAANHHVPFDITLMAMTMCAVAHADNSEMVEWTLYVPMRDGMSEGSMIGLFADWRDIALNVDFELATVLGCALQLNHIIQHRQWSVFNALRKPERTVVNVQVLEVEPRGGFKQIGEHGWWGGDRFKQNSRQQNQRGDKLGFAKQAITINIEQIADATWYIHIGVGADIRPPSWMRRFVASFQELSQNWLFNPLGKVHCPLPDTDLPNRLRVSV